MTAREHFTEFTQELHLTSEGIWHVTVDQVHDEVKSRDLSARCVDDSAIAVTPRGHSYLDFRAMAPKQQSKVAAALRTAATGNGAMATF